MSRLNSLIILGMGAVAGAAGTYWYSHAPATISTPAVAQQAAPSSAERKILYYRNPMGLPDTSPVSKKDPMGMDYIPVYQDEQDEPGTVKVSLDKIQRIGVKTEKVETRQIDRTVRAVGKVTHDESLLTIVALRADGFIEDLFVNKTGQHVSKGEPLFRVYSPQIQSAALALVLFAEIIPLTGHDDARIKASDVGRGTLQSFFRLPPKLMRRLSLLALQRDKQFSDSRVIAG